MLDHPSAPSPFAAAHSAHVYAQRLFRRTLAGWVLDCSRLHRKGLLRPCMRPGDGMGIGVSPRCAAMRKTRAARGS